jgi:hypothetical protein
MKKNFVEWLNGLETQTLTDELKSDIIERFQEDVENAVNNSGGYVDEVFWEEQYMQYTFTKGEQYYKKTYLD